MRAPALGRPPPLTEHRASDDPEDDLSVFLESDMRAPLGMTRHEVDGAIDRVDDPPPLRPWPPPSLLAHDSVGRTNTGEHVDQLAFHFDIGLGNGAPVGFRRCHDAVVERAEADFVGKVSELVGQQQILDDVALPPLVSQTRPVG